MIDKEPYSLQARTEESSAFMLASSRLPDGSVLVNQDNRIASRYLDTGTAFLPLVTGLTNSLTPRSCVLENQSVAKLLKISQHFMDPEI
jgi:hypothetical protein